MLNLYILQNKHFETFHSATLQNDKLYILKTVIITKCKIATEHIDF